MIICYLRLDSTVLSIHYNTLSFGSCRGTVLLYFHEFTEKGEDEENDKMNGYRGEMTIDQRVVSVLLYWQ